MKIRRLNIILAIFSLVFAFQLSLKAQMTKVSGRITDEVTNEPVPYASVFYKGTTIGVISGPDGSYLLETTHPGDSLHVTCIGYIPLVKPIKKGVAQVIDFKLNEEQVKLNEVVIVPEEDFIEILMGWIFRNKEKNNPEQIEYYQCEIYNKVQVDLNNITEDFQKRKIFKPFDFVFENIDSSSFNNKNYLPVFISESLSDFYYRKSPKTTKEFITANRVSGINNESITQYLGGISYSINIYDNYIALFEKNFISPIANFGLLTYHYYLEDTVVIDGHQCFQIRYEPKRKQELTFTGTMWIADTSFAVKRIEMQVTGDANFNFVNGYIIRQEYDKVNNKYWFLTEDYRLVDFNPLKNTKSNLFGAYTHRTSSYRNIIFDRPKDEVFYAAPLNVIIQKDAYDKDSAFWTEARYDSLSAEEQKIYKMVDSVKNVPVFHKWEDIAYLVTSGYLIVKKFEIGPLYKMVSYNAIEGLRLRFGGRTSNDFSKKLMLKGHIAYGTLDGKFKYGLGFMYMLSKNPRRSVGADFIYDMEQLGQDPNAYSEDNLFAGFFRRAPANKLNMVREFSGYYEHEWFTGFSNTIKLIHRDVYAMGNDKFLINEGNDQIVYNSLASSEIQLQTRFAYRERYLYGHFERTSVGTKYPIFELVYGYGIPNFFGGEFGYQRLQFRIKQWFNVANIGWSKYIFEVGKIWGTLPYPMLKIHEGNETILFYQGASNLMNYYEFISDFYGSLYYTHHFDGFFLNKIPLMKKLKWREVIHARGVWGTLSDKNAAYSEFPTISSSLEKPYFEAGVGIENILKFGRIDAIWRLSHVDEPYVDRFRIFISFQFSL